jgi:NAD(P)H-nitrite reductase large subunit
VTLLSSDEAAPYDRPNCSKDYLAGNAPEDWMPLRPPEFYKDQSIELELGSNVTGIDAKGRQVTLASGRGIPFDKLLLATGAEPVRLDIPGADQPHVHVLRSLADSRAIIAGAKTAQRAVVIGASFIGLEVAAALRTRARARIWRFRTRDPRAARRRVPSRGDGKRDRRRQREA